MTNPQERYLQRDINRIMQILGTNVPHLWLFTAGPGDATPLVTCLGTAQVLYNSSGSIKNFYTCIQATSSVAPSNTAYWTIVEIPYLFQPYLVHGAFADVLRMDGQMDKAFQQEKLAEECLEIEAGKLFNLQPQQNRIAMSAAY